MMIYRYIISIYYDIAIPILPATDLTPPKQRVPQLTLKGTNNLKVMQKGSDDFASQATISSGFLGTSLPSSQSYMKALGTGKLASNNISSSTNNMRRRLGRNTSSSNTASAVFNADKAAPSTLPLY